MLHILVDTSQTHPAFKGALFDTFARRHHCSNSSVKTPSAALLLQFLASILKSKGLGGRWGKKLLHVLFPKASALS